MRDPRLVNNRTKLVFVVVGRSRAAVSVFVRMNRQIRVVRVDPVLWVGAGVHRGHGLLLLNAAARL